MKITREDIGTGYLFDTSVENIFINEYMPLAPEGYVKVYLISKMYMELGYEVSQENIAKTLAMPVSEVEKAIIYWAKCGIIVRNSEGFEILSLKEKLYGKPKKKGIAKVVSPGTDQDNSKGKELLNNDAIKDLFEQLEAITGAFLTGNDTQEIISWLEDLKAGNPVIIGAAKYCKERKKTNIRYIGSVVKDWTYRGLATEEDVEKYLADVDQKRYAYRRVMRALGFSRNATEEERRIITSWQDDLGCSMNEILDACNKTSGISNPNINYINAVLKGKRGIKEDKKEISNSVILQYYMKLRSEAENAAKANKAAVEKSVPRIGKIENEMVDCSKELTTVMITGGPDKLERIEKIKNKLSELEKEKTVLMTEKNIPIDFMDVHYHCNKCNDTGTLEDGTRCQCWLTRSKEAKLWYQEEHSSQKELMTKELKTAEK